MFTNFANCITEAFVAGSERGEKLVAKCVQDEHYVEAVEKGHGVIVATATPEDGKRPDRCSARCTPRTYWS